MGQKINPIALRLGIINDWSSLWYSGKKSYRSNVLSDIKIREYLRKKLSHAMVGKVIIKRNSEAVEIIIHSAKPGVIIGKKRC